MAEFVYITCGIASTVCFLLLLRGYLHSRTRLLLWSSACFFGLFVNNALLFVDVVVVPDFDLGPFRLLVALIGFCLLVYGLIMETT